MEKGSGRGQTPGGWKGSLAGVLRDHNGAKAEGGSVASYATQEARRETLFKGFEDLRKAGYRLDTVASFRETHMKTLVQTTTSAGRSRTRACCAVPILEQIAGNLNRGDSQTVRDVIHLGVEVDHGQRVVIRPSGPGLR